MEKSFSATQTLRTRFPDGKNLFCNLLVGDYENLNKPRGNFSCRRLTLQTCSQFDLLRYQEMKLKPYTTKLKKLYLRTYIPNSIINLLLIYIKNCIKLLKESIKSFL